MFTSVGQGSVYLTGIIFARLLTGSLLLAAGAAKFTNHKRMVDVIEHYKVIPSGSVRYAAFALPIVEVIIGLGLICNLMLPWSSIGATLLFYLFSAAMSINLLRGRPYISCGCFGTHSDNTIAWTTVLRNAFLGMVTIAVTIQSIISADSGHSPSLQDTGAAALVLLSFFTIWWLKGAIFTLWRLPEP